MLKISVAHILPRRGKSCGFPSQSLTEFAIILPLVLMVLFVVIEIARLMHAWLAVENGARFGVRYAVTGEYNPQYCPADGCSSDLEFSSARIDSIHQIAWTGSSSIVRVAEGEVDSTDPSFFKVLVCEPRNLVEPDPGDPFSTYQCVPSESGGEPGERITVVVEFNHPLLTPFLTTIWPHLRLSAKREAIVEGYRIREPDINPPDYVPPTKQPTNTPKESTSTPLPTITPTPSATPTPDCDLIRIRSGLRFQGEDLVMTIRNDNPMNAFLSRSEFNAQNVTNSPPAYLDWLSFGFTKYYIANPPKYLNPSGEVVNNGLNIVLGSHSDKGWRADFEDASSPISGSFSVTLIFKFDNWPVECPIADSAYLEVQPSRTPWPTSTPGPTRTPRPTITPGPSPTPRPTRTPRPTWTIGPTPSPAPTFTPRPSTTPSSTPDNSGPPPDI